ncbi:26908_t:CDS:2 [Gigaspora margarita]|uniref:26908_t:CDS:1 n=1 Tax=Gigaspora margarita TaxID=4874 RepID=A0ABM8VW97_GIGMA|nr:26908_t:CDS:2 [Gigaspora margarita]
MELQVETDIIIPEIDTNVNSGTTNANVAGSTSIINHPRAEPNRSDSSNSVISEVYGLSREYIIAIEIINQELLYNNN